MKKLISGSLRFICSFIVASSLSAAAGDASNLKGGCIAHNAVGTMPSRKELLLKAGAAVNDSLKKLEKQVRARQLSEDGVAELEVILEKNPCEPHALVVLGIFYAQQGLVASAQESFVKAMRCNPKYAQAPIELAKLLLARGESRNAIAVIDSALKHIAKDPQLLLMKGYLLYLDHKYKDAGAVYALAKEENPQALGTESALAQLRLLNGQFGDALALAEADLSKDPEYFAANLAKGYALLGLKRAPLAIEPLQKAYQAVPFHPNLAFNLASCLQLAGKDARALEPALVNLALSVSTPDQPEAKELVTVVLRKIPEATASRIIELAGKKLANAQLSANLHFALGDVFDAMKQPHRAIEQYQIGLTIKPKFARGLFRLGLDFHSCLHRDKEALGYIERAAELAPEDQEIKVKLARLKMQLQLNESNKR